MRPDGKAFRGTGGEEEPDEIEILEVIGLDDDEPSPSGDDGGEPDEVEVVLDEPEEEGPAEARDDRGETVSRERLLRLQADFENLKKRIERERDDYYRHCTASLVSRLLPVLDNVELAIQASESATSASDDEERTLRDGVALIHRQFLEELRREGLRPIDAIGEAFDPTIHEAVATEYSAELPHNTIIEELRKGYLFHERLLRPAMVRVNVDPNASEEEES